LKEKTGYNELENINIFHLKTLAKGLLIGLLVGAVITLYRIALVKAEAFAFVFYEYFRQRLYLIPVMVLLLGLCGYFIGALKQRYKMIGGSGIPQTKGIILGYFKQSWLGTLVAKFAGGVISVGAGLALGREGPSIQLGACVAEGVSKRLSHSPTERKILISSGASAGLAAAFNAPMSGAMFVLEELFKYFSPIILVTTLMAAIVGDFISKSVFGLDPVFDFHITHKFLLKEYWMLILLGVIVGMAGTFYNFFLKKVQLFYSKIKLSDKAKPIIPFLLAGVLGLTFPTVLGSGHIIMEGLTPSSGLLIVVVILVVKFLFSMICFGSGAPGGIFFPLLVMGATIGSIFGIVCIKYLGVDESLFYNFMMLAMVGFFTSIVRAPITGMILVLEMTGSFSNLLSMSIVVISSYIVAEALKCTPIYDYLLDKQLEDDTLEEIQENGDKVLIQMIVHHGSYAEGKHVKSIGFPKHCLLVGIKRGEKELIPKGDTEVLANDLLVFLVHSFQEGEIREEVERIIQYI
jgi:H+/Cl- antiporter ClcA